MAKPCSLGEKASLLSEANIITHSLLPLGRRGCQTPWPPGPPPPIPMSLSVTCRVVFQLRCSDWILRVCCWTFKKSSFLSPPRHGKPQGFCFQTFSGLVKSLSRVISLRRHHNGCTCCSESCMQCPQRVPGMLLACRAHGQIPATSTNHGHGRPLAEVDPEERSYNRLCKSTPLGGKRQVTNARTVHPRTL